MNLTFRNTVCHTEGCISENIIMRAPSPDNCEFLCGPCGVMITDVTIALDQETREGCVDFCPEPENHVGPFDCNAALVERSK